jgi:uncharacterized protein YqgV (UPF0045/DUF77 family)
VRRVRAEFTIEPFVDGDPGPHVGAGLDAVRAAGFEPDVGPFGTMIEGDPARVHDALRVMLDQATAAGATRVSIQVSQTPAQRPQGSGA